MLVTTVRGRRVRALCTFTCGAVRKEDTVKTLRHLLRHVHGPIILVWDGLAQHRSQLVRDFLLTRANRRVTVERFPAYAPELNPQEYLWAASKTKDLAGYVPADTDSLLTRARRSIRRIQRSPDILRGALYRSGLFTRGS
jgi:transposase